MKKILPVLLLSLIFIAGCGKDTPTSNNNLTETTPMPQEQTQNQNVPVVSKEEFFKQEKFELTTNDQDAVFYIKDGFTGGPSIAVVDVAKGGIKTWNDKAIYPDAQLTNHVQAAMTNYTLSGNESCKNKIPVFRVTASIQLREKTESNPSVPGGSSTSYYEAVVKELKSMEAEPC